MNKITTPSFLYSTLLLFAFTFLICFSANGQSILPSEKQTLFAHLNDVNKEWSKQTIDHEFYNNEITFENDQQRIQLHLKLVEAILRKKATPHLSEIQLTRRLHHLDVLKKYWQEGVFPINIFHSQRQPYFVDHQGTACAVGYLVREDGGEALVQKIKNENNYAYVAELKNDYPQLGEWAANNGFTLDELAWIQPGYPPAAQVWNSVGNDGGTDGKINVMKTSEDGSLLYLAGDFSEVDGVAANSIIAWDGTEWQTLGAGVEGEIFTIETTYDDQIYIGGNFLLNDDTQYSNIAFWDGETWEGLQKGDMNGSVYALKFNGQLYAGGDFQNIDNQSISYLARLAPWQADGEWNNHVVKYVGPNVYDTIQNAMAVNAPVKALELVDNRLLVGGSFTQTAPDISDNSINKLPANYLAYWYNENWIVPISGEHAPSEKVAFLEGRLLTGGQVANQNPIGIFTAGFWDYPSVVQLDEVEGDGLIHGFLEYKDRIYAFGDVANSPVLGIYSKGFVEVAVDQNASVWNGGGALFDKTVRAAAVFQDEVYFAGDFTKVGNGWTGEEFFNGLVSSPLDAFTSTTDPGFVTNKIQVSNSGNELLVRYEDLEENATLNLYNLQGQILKTINLQKGDDDFSVSLSNWSAGAYVYQVVNERRREAGKFLVFRK